MDLDRKIWCRLQGNVQLLQPSLRVWICSLAQSCSAPVPFLQVPLHMDIQKSNRGKDLHNMVEHFQNLGIHQPNMADFMSPCLTLVSVSLRLHLSWTLDHVLIPVGRLKNPLLCKAGARGSGGDNGCIMVAVWLPYGAIVTLWLYILYPMVTICLHKGFRSMKAVGKPQKKLLRSWLQHEESWRD